MRPGTTAPGLFLLLMAVPLARQTYTLTYDPTAGTMRSAPRELRGIARQEERWHNLSQLAIMGEAMTLPGLNRVLSTPTSCLLFLLALWLALFDQFPKQYDAMGVNQIGITGDEGQRRSGGGQHHLPLAGQDDAPLGDTVAVSLLPGVDRYNLA